MIEEIKRKYEDFSDCLILEFAYKSYSIEFKPVDEIPYWFKSERSGDLNPQ